MGGGVGRELEDVRIAAGIGEDEVLTVVREAVCEASGSDGGLAEGGAAAGHRVGGVLEDADRVFGNFDGRNGARNFLTGITGTSARNDHLVGASCGVVAELVPDRIGVGVSQRIRVPLTVELLRIGIVLGMQQNRKEKGGKAEEEKRNSGMARAHDTLGNSITVTQAQGERAMASKKPESYDSGFFIASRDG